jgi:3-methyladenine DNA glycosylase AlkC
MSERSTISFFAEKESSLQIENMKLKKKMIYERRKVHNLAEDLKKTKEESDRKKRFYEVEVGTFRLTLD